MKKGIIKIFFFIAFCGGFAACKKEEKVEVVTFPVELAYNNTTIKKPVRLFSGGKEIKDSAIIYKFLGVDKELFISTNWGVDMGKLKFTSADTLEFPFQDSNGRLPFFLDLNPWELTIKNKDFAPENFKNIKYSVEKNHNQINFYSLKPIGTYTEYFGFNFLKYTAPLIEIPHLTVPGEPNYLKTTKRMLVGNGSYTDINMSYIICKYVYSINSNYKYRSNTSNEFNEDIITTLGVRDTLAVTTFSINYKKQ